MYIKKSIQSTLRGHYAFNSHIFFYTISTINLMKSSIEIFFILLNVYNGKTRLLFIIFSLLHILKLISKFFKNRDLFLSYIS
jgi:hypothetical protein